MSVLTDESTSQNKHGRQPSEEHEENAEQLVEDWGRKQKKKKKKESRIRKLEVEEHDVQDDAPKRKKKKKNKIMQTKWHEIRSGEEDSIENEIQKDQNDKVETNKKKNKQRSQVTKEKKQMSDKVKPKGSEKKKNTKTHPEAGLPYDEDINPIHFHWAPSEDLKQTFSLREGKWSKKEEKILQENMEQYLLENNLDDPSKLIFAYLNDDLEEAKKWKEFAKTTDFYRKLGKGLNRSIYLIYRKVLRSFDEGNYQGSFTESEDKELEKLVALHGKKWEKIGRMMGRSGLAVYHRYNWNSGARGLWKDSEVDLLKEAVRKVTNTAEGVEIFSNINWNAVASSVKTRNAEQCRKKWLYQICWKECSSAPRQKWGLKEDLKLIKLVYESSVTHECEIEWCEMQKHFELARSPEWLSNKFTILLRRYCDAVDLENTDFEDVIDYLYNVKRKELEDNADS